MENPIDSFENHSGTEKKKWISVKSELESLDGSKKEIKIELMEDGLPRATAFFDIDGTLAHLDAVHGRAIAKLFPEQDPKELEETYYRGFKLGNSFREFDRMRGIYFDKHIEWKDPEIYLKNRFIPNAKEIDESGHSAHDIAAGILQKYGEIAAEVCEEIYKNNPGEFRKSNIEPIFLLAKMYSRLGIPMVGFTANAKIFVDQLAKYLGLADIFLDIATDETMTGGGKEVAIPKLIHGLEIKGIPASKNRIFVGDSIRGDIGTSLLVQEEKDPSVLKQGILVLKDKKALIEIQKQINKDKELRTIADSVAIYALLVEDVPLDEHGEPMLFSRFRERFLVRL